MTTASSILDRRPRLVRGLAAAALFILAACFWFHGIAAHPDTRLLRGFGDGTSQLRDYWAARHLGATPFTFARDSLTGAPEGRPLSTAIQIAQAFQPGFVWALRPVLGLVGAWNLLILAGFAGTALSAFLLLDRLGCTFAASLFGGYVFGFNPWAFERASAGAPAFLQGWIFVVLYAALTLTRRRTLASAVPGGIALAASFYVASYFGLLALLVVVLYWALEATRAGSLRGLVRPAQLAAVQAGTTALCLAPVIVAYVRDRSSVVDQISNPSDQLQHLGARVPEYFLPYGRHPFLGSLTRSYPNSGNFPEQSLFFGYSTMALAVVAVVLLLRRSPWLRSRPERRDAATFFALLVPLAFLCSLPSHVGVLGISVPMPSAAISHVTTFWRVYARFGVLVGLGLAVLAGLALSRLQQARGGRVLALVALAVVAGIELLPGSITTIDARAQPAYVRWLARHPGGIVATYPAPTDRASALFLAEREYWYQRFHAHPLYGYFGSGTGGTREDAIRILSRYADGADTPGVLAAEHVRYVVLHDDVYRSEGRKPPASVAGATPVARFGPVRILQLGAVPPVDITKLLDQQATEIATVQGLAPPSVVYGDGYDVPDQQSGRRQVAGRSELHLLSSDPRVTRLEVQFNASSSAPLAVDVSLDDGASFQTLVLSPTENRFTVGPFGIHPGETTLVLRARNAAPDRPAFVAAAATASALADYSVSLAAR